MLIVAPETEIEIPIVYKDGYTYVDPNDDLTVFVKRGYGTPGPVILGPAKYSVSSLSGGITIQRLEYNSISMKRNSTGSYTLKIKLPKDLFDGTYTVEVRTKVNDLDSLKETFFQCKAKATSYDNSYDVGEKFVEITNRARYKTIGNSTTLSTLLIGHTDALEPYGILKIHSMQEAVNILRADLQSPLLRGIFDAYSCGAKDIYIMSCGYMSEYLENVSDRNTLIFSDNSSTPNRYSFYDLYYLRLDRCYELLRDYEFFDIIVPLEVSMINTGNNNFVKQLADHCQLIQETTGEVQIGIIGSRSNGISKADIDELAVKDFNLSPQIDSNDLIIKDPGRYIVLVYGEAVFSHDPMQRSYTSSLAAPMAGMLASTRLDRGLAKARVPGALSVHGAELNLSDIKKLEEAGINTIIRGQRARRQALFDVILTNDYTQSVGESFKDSVNVRLVSVIIKEIQALGNAAIGKFGYDKIIRYVEEYMQTLQQARLIINYKVDSYADRYDVGKLYFNINITSARTLRSISFNVSTGKAS